MRKNKRKKPDLIPEMFMFIDSVHFRIDSMSYLIQMLRWDDPKYAHKKMMPHSARKGELNKGVIKWVDDDNVRLSFRMNSVNCCMIDIRFSPGYRPHIDPVNTLNYLKSVAKDFFKNKRKIKNRGMYLSALDYLPSNELR